MRRRLAEYLRTVFHPAGYHGDGKSPPFFEGWYIKVVDARERQRFAVIPGVFLANDDSHAFVQVLDGVTGESSYHRYPLSEFSASPDVFDVRVGENRFSAAGARIRLELSGRPLSGELTFEGGAPWPVTWASPGVMGPFGWLTFMECYHGVLSFDHAIRGALSFGGETIDFTGGRGYIEKDWGEAFPSAYVWQQTNHFGASSPGTSLVASVAVIPSVVAFRGFIVGFRRAGRLYRFATYTGARIEKLDITDTHVAWVVRGGGHRLEMTSTRAAGGLLHAPIRTEMHKRVDETLSAVVDVRLTSSRSGGVLFRGEGRHAGLEVHGDLERLLRM